MENQESRNFRGELLADEDEDKKLENKTVQSEAQRSGKTIKPEIFTTPEVIGILGAKSEMIAELQGSYSNIAGENDFKVYEHNYVRPILVQ